MRKEFDKEIKASNIEKATEKFCKILRDNGYDWTADSATRPVFIETPDDTAKIMLCTCRK